jgi:diaminohydroxyphosphoribosylaminopyrimidine deaminase/5-amino-6-(5-phosphoribosylamino)uracil reductase
MTKQPPLFNPHDAQLMDRALVLAQEGRWHCPPNPSVGCVITDSYGNVIGQGYTQAVGQAHAEIMALRDAVANGYDVRGANVYVTLEPCSHQGRTGPCCDALINAGVARVFAAISDPNPLVAGQGIARLRSSGIEVNVGLRESQAREINLGFFSRIERGRPWVRVKSAASLDGRTALPDGTSEWITCSEARADGHAWRARAGAIFTGIGTVLHDNPMLNARVPGITREPDLVIVDSHLRTPSEFRLWKVARRHILIYTADDITDINRERAQRLRDQGATLVVCRSAQGQVDLAAALTDLARREVSELHVEAGGILTGALLQAGLVDELLLYQAPLLLGQGFGIATIQTPAKLCDALRWQLQDVKRIGSDLRLVMRNPNSKQKS